MPTSSVRPTFRQTLRLAACLCPLLLGAPAAAQDIATAEALFDRGLSDMQAGKYETGCKALGDSHRLDPRPGTLFTLATCESRWGRLATAFTRFGDYLELYQRLPEDRRAGQGERPDLARAEREKLAPQVPRLTLSLPGTAPPGTVVKRDGQVVPESALGVALPVDPGEHLLSTTAPGGVPLERRIRLDKGEKKQVTLEVSLPPGGARETAPRSPASSPPPAPAATEPGGWRNATYTIGGVGLAGLVAGGVLGGLALERKGVVDRHCGAAIGASDETACDPTGLEAASAGKAMSLASTIGVGVGLAGVGTAVVLLLTEPKPPAPKGAARGWISAGVLSAGPAGAVLGAQGAW